MQTEAPEKLSYDKTVATRGAFPDPTGRFCRLTPLLIRPNYWNEMRFLDELDGVLAERQFQNVSDRSIFEQFQDEDHVDGIRNNSNVFLHTVGTCNQEYLDLLKFLDPEPKFVVQWTDPKLGISAYAWEGPSDGVVDYTENIMFFLPKIPINIEDFRLACYTLEHNRTKGVPPIKPAWKLI